MTSATDTKHDLRQPANLDAPVGIVGAGPVGLTAAARLASFGIASLVFECEAGLVERGSKACLIQGDALEVLDKVGCAGEIEREGVTWNIGHTYVRGREIATTEYPTCVGPGPFVNISQFRVEEVLRDYVAAAPCCEVLWSQCVIAIEQQPNAVVVTIADNEGRSRNLRVGYLIACDGARSQLREMLGVQWNGYRHADEFLITDIRARLPYEKERHFHYDPPFNRGRQVVVHPQPEDVWRIDIQLPPGMALDGGTYAPGQSIPDEVHRRLRLVLGDLPYEVKWWSTYGFHQRVVDRFRVGRAFLSGDAAHTFPPYGARGMNSGIQDVDNLAWKLASVLADQSDEALLDTYHEERYAAALENLRVTEATIRFMAPPTLRERLRRNALLRLATAPGRRASTWARNRIDSGKMTQPFVYTASSGIDFSVEHPLVGAVAPDAFVETDEGRYRLRQLFGRGFVVLAIGSVGADLDRFVEATATETVERIVAVVGEGAVTCPAARVVRAGAELSTAYDVSPEYGVLVRPDGYVGAVFAVADGATSFLELLGRVRCQVARSSLRPVDDRVKRDQ